MQTEYIIQGMRKQVDFLKKDPEREYTIADFKRYKLMPWARNYRTLAKLIKQDFLGENVLKAKIEGEGKLIRYTIKGKHIINFINLYGPYLMGTIRKPKQTWKTQKTSRS